MRKTIITVCTLVLGGCASSYSTIRDEGVAYALDRQQAKEIVESSILAHFSPDYVNAGPAR